MIQVVVKCDLTFFIRFFKLPYLSPYVVYFYISLQSSLSFLVFFLDFSPWLNSFLSLFKSHLKQIQKHVRLKQFQDSLRLEITHSWIMFSVVFTISYLKWAMFFFQHHSLLKLFYNHISHCYKGLINYIWSGSLHLNNMNIFWPIDLSF